MANFPTAPLPSYPVKIDWVKPDVLISTHRDGSEQRRFRGAGAKRKFELNFGSDLPLTKAEHDVLLAHYAANLGELQSFNWVHPETAETIKVRYAGRPSFSHLAYNCYSGAIALQEVPA
jgi:phage-related protein